MFQDHHKKSSARDISATNMRHGSSSRNMGMPIPGADSRRIIRERRDLNFGAVSQSVPLPTSSKPSNRCPRPPHRGPRAPTKDPPNCTLPPSPQQFSLTEIESLMEGRKMSVPEHHNARSVPTDVEFEQMSRSLGHRNGFIPTVSPLIEKQSPETLADDMTDLNLSTSATVLSFMMGSVDSQASCDSPMQSFSHHSSTSSRPDTSISSTAAVEIPGQYQSSRHAHDIQDFEDLEKPQEHTSYAQNDLQFQMDLN